MRRPSASASTGETSPLGGILQAIPGLSGGSQQEQLDWLREQDGSGVIAIVGHEPWLGELVSWLLSNQGHGFVELKKGAACLLAFPGRVAPGAALLRWALPPRALRELGRVEPTG